MLRQERQRIMSKKSWCKYPRMNHRWRIKGDTWVCVYCGEKEKDKHGLIDILNETTGKAEE
jgi:hypothetical protein